MARSRTPKPTQTDFDLGNNYQPYTRSARGPSPRADRSKFNNTHHELEYEGGSLTRARNKFQVDWKLRGEHRQSDDFVSACLRESSHASTSNLDEKKNRFSSPVSSRPHQDADFVNAFGAGWSRVASVSCDRQSYQLHLSYPPPSSLSPDRELRRGGSSQRVHQDNREFAHHPSSPTRAAERFAQNRSDWFSASIQPWGYSNTPIQYPHIGTPQEPFAHRFSGLTRRPRVQNHRKRVSQVQRDGPKSSVDLETPQVTEMDKSVMSVSRPNPDGSGFSSGSRSVPIPTAARPMTIGDPDCGARRLGSPAPSFMQSETEQPQSGIKAREEAGSVFTNIYSVPKKEPLTFTAPFSTDCMEDEPPSLSPVSTPKAPPLDQHSVIREDLQQQGERPIEGCRTNPRISFRETAAVEDRESLDSIHSTSLRVSQLQSHATPANKDDGKMKPGQQALLQELYQMIEFSVHPASDTLRSGMEMGRDGKSAEGITRTIEEESSPDIPRGLQGPEQTLHVDILLAQRVVRDAMQMGAVGFPDQSFLLSASECGEEVVDSNSNWSECGLYRKNSTRSVFDWGYA